MREQIGFRDGYEAHWRTYFSVHILSVHDTIRLAGVRFHHVKPHLFSSYEARERFRFKLGLATSYSCLITRPSNKIQKIGRAHV